MKDARTLRWNMDSDAMNTNEYIRMCKKDLEDYEYSARYSTQILIKVRVITGI